MSATQAETVLQLVGEAGLLRPRELEPHGIPRSVLARLVERRQLVREGRGLYRLPNADITEHHSLAEVAKRVPQGIVCLLTALRFHEMTTEAPFEVWMLLDVHAATPHLDYPPLRVVRASGDALSHGVELHLIEGVSVPITSPARTVADCFKYRNKIGIGVASAALRDYLEQRRGTSRELWKACQVCRMTRVIQPYLEALA